MTTREDLLALFTEPATLGRRASARRDELRGRTVTIRPEPELAPPDSAALVRRNAAADLPAWPHGGDLRDRDLVVLQVPASAEGRLALLDWLDAEAEGLPTVVLAPYSREAAGLHRLFCLAACRLLTPGAVSIAVRHDLVGIRLAQIALGFGVDTFAGPLAVDRKLPLAGVTRPNEATATGVATLIEQAGLQPILPAPSETP